MNVPGGLLPSYRRLTTWGSKNADALIHLIHLFDELIMKIVARVGVIEVRMYLAGNQIFKDVCIQGERGWETHLLAGFHAQFNGYSGTLGALCFGVLVRTLVLACDGHGNIVQSSRTVICDAYMELSLRHIAGVYIGNSYIG